MSCVIIIFENDYKPLYVILRATNILKSEFIKRICHIFFFNRKLQWVLSDVTSGVLAGEDKGVIYSLWIFSIWKKIRVYDKWKVNRYPPLSKNLSTPFIFFLIETIILIIQLISYLGTVYLYIVSWLNTK